MTESSFDCLSPGATVGILGGGQLGRLLASAAAELGFACHVLAPDPQSPAFDLAARATIASYGDRAALEAFARSCDIVTYEFENVPVAALEAIEDRVAVRPGRRSLEMSQDRLLEKIFISGLGLDVAQFSAVDDADALEAAMETTGLPAILKTRRDGYDGKGQVRLARADQGPDALAELGGRNLILEGFVAFRTEVSVVGVRAQDGAFAAYEATENHHRDGILRTSRVPADIPPGIADRAVSATREIAAALDHVGAIGVEFFVREEAGPEPALIVNEIAPRVHNSAHWTLDACGCSQFENHIRAIVGWPLGETDRHSGAVMDNLIGNDVARWREIAADPRARLHLYGKRDTRPGRKMGHVTRLS